MKKRKKNAMESTFRTQTHEKSKGAKEKWKKNVMESVEIKRKDWEWNGIGNRGLFSLCLTWKMNENQFKFRRNSACTLL